MTKSILSAIILITLSLYHPISAATPLRGYGSVKASFNNNFASFQCENKNFAEIVYAKLIRDIKECASSNPIQDYKVGIKDSIVYVVSANSKDEVDTLSKKLNLEFPEPKPYPNYLTPDNLML